MADYDDFVELDLSGNYTVTLDASLHIAAALAGNTVPKDVLMLLHA